MTDDKGKDEAVFEELRQFGRMMSKIRFRVLNAGRLLEKTPSPRAYNIAVGLLSEGAEALSVRSQDLADALKTDLAKLKERSND